MQVKIGTGPDSWGVWFADDPRQTPWNRFLDEAVQAGYSWIELGPHGYLPTDIDVLERELGARGLGVSGTCVMQPLEDPAAWPEVERQILAVGPILNRLDAHTLVLIDDTYSDMATGVPRAPKRLDHSAWRRLIEATHRAADLARERFDLKLAFHPHSETHVEYEDQIEQFLSDTDPGRVSICFDVGHHAYRGGDPLKFIRRHHRRITYLHLKSVDSAIRQQVDAGDIRFAQAVALGIFCEPDRGVLDFRALRDLLAEIDFRGFGIVEQDMYPTSPDKPLPIAKRTRDYLREIKLG